MVRDHVAHSFHIERDDLELSPFDNRGGLGRMHRLFGGKLDGLLDELNLETAVGRVRGCV
jgi:type I restriction enzyme R subunit